MASIKLHAIVTIATFICSLSFNSALAGLLPKFPAILIFGDSTMDTGNNNYIDTLLRANFFPYGENFPGQKATGRFSDGELIPDMLASALGIKAAVPPFLYPNLSDQELVTGVSFASAGAGYDTETNAILNVIPVPEQIGMFKNYTARLKRIVGEEKAQSIIGGALVLISAGSSDVLTRPMTFNYNYHDLLLNTLQSFIKELYDLGCRSILVAGLPAIGYVPLETTVQTTIQITIRHKKSLDLRWLDDLNAYAESYNEKLVKLLPQLQSTYTGSKMFYIDIYEPLVDMVHNPQKYGFLETKRGCCGTGILEMGPLCNAATPKCGKLLAPRFMFWDSVHPTRTTYQNITNNIVKNVLPKFL